MTFEDCIYPDCDMPGVDDWGLCGHHHWMVAAELATGHRELAVYLDGWARFAEWLEAHRVVV